MDVQFFTQDDPRFKQAMMIRNEVFIKEQNIAPMDEIDGQDGARTHVVGFIDNTPVAAARLQEDENTITIQRVAVLKSYRKTGAGRLLIEAIEDYARNKEVNQLALSSQQDVVPFYQKLGFTDAGHPTYIDAGIPHMDMVKKLS